jgi:hypothetical protein
LKVGYKYATAIKMDKKHHGDLGKQRLFGVIGQAICVIIIFIKCLNYSYYSTFIRNICADQAVLAGIIFNWTVVGKGFRIRLN